MNVLNRQNSSIAYLCNIGPITVEWLKSINIHNRADLERVGSIRAYHLLKKRHPQKVSLNLLYALEGALLNLSIQQMPKELKNHLKQEAELLTAKSR